MLVESVSVKNFKLLGDFSVGGLRPFTLVGGGNGCGKTTLLEAALTCFHRKWSDDELPPIFNPSLRDESVVNEDAFTRLAYGGEEFNVPMEISFGMKNGIRHTVKITPQAGAIGENSFRPYKTEKSESGVFIPQFARHALVAYSAEYADKKEPRALGEIMVTLDHNGWRLQFLNIPNPNKNDSCHFMFMSHGGLLGATGQNDADCLSELEIRGDKNSIIDALRIVSPKAKDVTVASIRNKPLVFVQMDGMKRKIPAALLGTGAQKILSMSLGLHSINDGLCLLDEVTVGWHHSLLVDLWRMIFRVCRERNHQVIATTHSDEGVTAFVKAAEAERAESDCCYLRPWPDGDIPGKVNCEYYDYGRLRASRDIGAEVR